LAGRLHTDTESSGRFVLVSIGAVIVSLAVILAGAELFTNSIEWLGRRMRLAEGAVGSILAAVGTALPETLIPIIAIVFEQGEHADSIGIGAILGAPLMLSTLAMFVTGFAILICSMRGHRPREVVADYAVVGRDLRSFVLVFSLAVAAAFLPARPYKHAAAAMLVVIYAIYVRRTFQGASAPEEGHDIAPLHLRRSSIIPRYRYVLCQLFVALAAIIGGAHLFVHHLSEIAHATGVSALVLSVIITPIATELPEKFNSVLWVRRGKDTLALGNISGAMVFQSSIPPAVGLICTDWALTDRAIAAAVAAIAASGLALGEMMWRKRISAWSLLLGIVFYAAYLAYVFSTPGVQ